MNLMTLSQDDVWHKMWKENSPELRNRAIVWRKEDAVTRIERPSSLLRARRLGYKAKQGIVVIRISPQSKHTFRIIEIFKAAANDADLEPLEQELPGLLPIGACNVYILEQAGMNTAGPGQI